MKRFQLLLLILFGFLFFPSNTFACGNHSDNTPYSNEISSVNNGEDCCSKNHSLRNESSKKSEKKSCCNKKNEKKDNNSCGGKCKNARCNCPPLIFSYEFDFTYNSFCFSYKKQKSNLLETPISAGFYSIWLIPKIS